MKAKKYQFITIFLVLMFCLIGAVSATEDVTTDTPSTTTADQTVSTQAVHEDLSEKVSSTTPTKTVTDDTPKEKTNKEKIGTNDNTKTTNKTETNTETTTKNTDNKLKAQNNENTLTETNTEPLKTGTKTVNVNDITELTNTINSAVQDTENDTYIINLNPGTYQDDTNTITLNAGSSTPNIIINANEQSLKWTKGITFSNKCNITLNNATLLINDDYINIDYSEFYLNNVLIQTKIRIRNNAQLNIQKSTINSTLMIPNSAMGLRIASDCIIGENFGLSGTGMGKLETDNPAVIEVLKTKGVYLGDNTIKNTTINNKITNKGFLTVINSTLNSEIVNTGTLSIDDDTTFGPNFKVTGSGNIIINDTTRISLKVQIYNDDMVIKDATISDADAKTNYATLTIINSTINSFITNYGKIIFKNSTLTNTITLYPGSTVIFEDDVIFGDNFKLQPNAEATIIINDTQRIANHMNVYYGDFILENTTINVEKTNYGNLTIRNSTINQKIENNGKLTLENNTILKARLDNLGTTTIRNSTINGSIQNSGTLIIEDNVIIGDKCQISGPGKIITNDINKLFPYLVAFYGEATVELGDYKNGIQNYGNLTILNSTFTNDIANFEGTLTFKNCTLNNTIQNLPAATLIISEDTIIGENFQLIGNGAVISNNTNPKLIDSITTYDGNMVLNNKTITTPKINKGTLTLTNCTINSTINNQGILIISDDTIFGENANITGTGEIQIKDITKILPIIETIKGNYIINDTTLTKKYVFDGTITLNNCTITSTNNTNFGTLTLNNCTVNVGEDNTFLRNYGRVYIKDTKITGKITGDEENVFYEGVAKIYNINNGTIDLYFEDTGLNSIIRPGDVLNFQGNILLTHDLIIDTPVNINSENAYLNGNQLYKFTITEDGAYTNITGISFNNTKILINAKYVTLENTNINGTIKLDGSNNTITNNKIITDDEYTITSTIGQNNTITDNYLVAKTLIGDKTVNLDASNIIENNIPSIVKIEITVNPENTVNKTATIIIVLKDEYDNLIANQKVNLTIGSSTQEVDLKNGFILYTYTPKTVGEDTVTVKYNGDGIYLPATNDTILNVTADKDKIIQALEEANETNTQTINDLNKEITNKTGTIDELNNTVKAQTTTIQNQDKTIQNQTETIKKQDNTIQSQTQQITEANNKAAVAEQKASQATVPIKKVKASKTVKKSKNFKIKVTLKKAVKGKKVFVIFNGKTYTKKTNKKGIATITIKKSALKKLGGKKVKYQIISGEKIIKKTVKVKK